MKRKISSHVAFSQPIVKNRFQSQALFIFNNHVVHDNIDHHDIRNCVQIPLLHSIFDNLPSNLWNSKCSFYILLHIFQAFGEMLFHDFLWFMNGLHKASPWRINAIFQEIKAWIDMTINLKYDVVAFFCKIYPSQEE